MTTSITPSETISVPTTDEMLSNLSALMSAFKGQTIVIKAGGSSLLSPTVKAAIVKQVTALTKIGLKVVIVHGGGTSINEALLKANISTKKIRGLRVTDISTIDIVIDVLTNINKQLVKDFETENIHALAIKNIFLCKKLKLQGDSEKFIDLGWVGDIQHVDLFAIHQSLACGYIPVLSPIGIDSQGNFYNLNADHAAVSLAASLQADKLIFLTDVPGVLKDISDPASKISHISTEEIQYYIDANIVTGGMLPKMQGCITGIRNGLKQICIINGFSHNAIIKGILSPNKVGTVINEGVGMKTTNYINKGQSALINIYARYPIILTKGKGCYVEDISGKSYLDFFSGFAVNALGHCHPKVVETITEQANQLIHCSNLYFTPPLVELAEVITKISGFDKAFFCNSGTEATETAIKLARKFSKQTKGVNCIEVIAIENSFHGRTLGALSATGQTKYQKDFLPLLEGFKIVPLNISAIEAAISQNTSAIIIEPIQGEGGIKPVPDEILKTLRQICDKNGIVLIFDEVQCGIGRTGKFFAYENYGIKPDIITLAKGLGSGFPIGAVLSIKRIAESFQPGDHGTTFGGNPLACAVALTVINEINQPSFLKQVNDISTYLKNALFDLKKKYSSIVDIRGQGLMLGVELDCPVSPIVETCMSSGLLIGLSGSNVLRLLPPLIVSKQEVDEGITILDKVFASVPNQGEIK